MSYLFLQIWIQSFGKREPRKSNARPNLIPRLDGALDGLWHDMGLRGKCRDCKAALQLCQAARLQTSLAISCHWRTESWPTLLVFNFCCLVLGKGQMSFHSAASSALLSLCRRESSQAGSSSALCFTPLQQLLICTTFIKWTAVANESNQINC